MMHRKENPFLSLSFNIILPVLILNKGQLLDPSGVITLFVALAFPSLYGAYDWIRNKKKNIIAIFGVLNVLMSGGFALFHLDGIWFAVKEASFPLLIGAFVLFSATTKTPFFEYMLVQSGLIKLSNLIPNNDTDSLSQIKKIFKQSTILFSASFFISAILNFLLAWFIFSPISESSSEVDKTLILNQQIADMTWMGMLVIGVPMTIIAAWIFWQFLKKLSLITKTPIEQILDSLQNKK